MNAICPPSVDYLTGEIEADDLITKVSTLGSLKNVFADQVAQATMPQETLVYHVAMLPAETDKGELNFGVTHIEPGRVGEEFYMTRGHLHEHAEQAEYYFGVAGKGLLLMQSLDGRVELGHVFAGSVHHIRGYVAHRLINIGDERLSALAVWPAIAGHDYQFIDKIGFKIRVVWRDGEIKVVEGGH
ncbi:glucose-6-phosphate isomerase family protein [Vibrio sp.]|uniref:glucose-6-phosphate isomerase family protein n=1 Tax=Vibrio sp. TaxID=678 RepID=UPI003D0A6F59